MYNYVSQFLKNGNEIQGFVQGFCTYLQNTSRIHILHTKTHTNTQTHTHTQILRLFYFNTYHCIISSFKFQLSNTKSTIRHQQLHILYTALPMEFPTHILLEGGPTEIFTVASTVIHPQHQSKQSLTDCIQQQEQLLLVTQPKVFISHYPTEVFMVVSTLEQHSITHQAWDTVSGVYMVVSKDFTTLELQLLATQHKASITQAWDTVLARMVLLTFQPQPLLAIRPKDCHIQRLDGIMAMFSASTEWLRLLAHITWTLWISLIGKHLVF